MTLQIVSWSMTKSCASIVQRKTNFHFCPHGAHACAAPVGRFLVLSSNSPPAYMFMVCSNIKLTFPAKSIVPTAYIFLSNPKGIVELWVTCQH
jgi:hypothetical protein